MTQLERIQNMELGEMAGELDYFLNREVASATNQCSLCPARNFCEKYKTCQTSIIKWLESEVD